MTYNNAFHCGWHTWHHGAIGLANNDCQHINNDGEVVPQFWKGTWDCLDVCPQGTSCERYNTIVCFLNVTSSTPT